MSIQTSVQGGLLRPLRKAGLALASRWPWPVRARTRSGSRMFVDLRSPIGRAIYMKGDFDPKVFEPLAQVLKPGGIFLDVGANIGFYSVMARELVGDSGAVHSFEIDPRPLRCLRQTISHAGWRNVYLHEMAAGDVDGEATLQQRDDSGHSSVTRAGTGLRVKMTTLDSWSNNLEQGKVQAVKIDTEGGELPVLLGAKNLLKRHRPLLVCEVVDDPTDRRYTDTAQIFALLESAGYRWRWLVGCNDPTLVAEAV